MVVIDLQQLKESVLGLGQFVPLQIDLGDLQKDVCGFPAGG